MSMVPATRPAGGLINFGSQELDATDFILPRVKILQPMSAESDAERGGKPGDLYNTLTQENYGPSLKVVPITPLKQRVFLFREQRREFTDALLINAGLPVLSEDDGLKCRSLDMVRGVGEPGDTLWFGDPDSGQGAGHGCLECPLSHWMGNKPPPCTETYNVAGVTDAGDFVIVSMSKSGAKTGKQWFSMLRLREGAPWLRTYEVTTSKRENDQGKFWVPQVALLPGTTPPDLIAMAARWAERLQGRVIDVTPLAAEDDEPTVDDSADLRDAAF